MTFMTREEMDKGMEEIMDMPNHIAFVDEHFVIDYGGYDYNIEQSRVKTYPQLVEWILHLSDKSWMDSIRMRYFASLVAKHNNLPFPGAEQV